VSFVREVRWGDLHVGDVIRGRSGDSWTVLDREAAVGQRTRWVGSGGGGYQDLFGLVSSETGKVIRATRHLADPVPLLSRADRSEHTSACDALTAAGFEVELIREGQPMSDVTEMLQGMAEQPSGVNPPCSHPDDQRSTLRDGRHYCTACFETTYDPNPAAIDVLGVELAANIEAHAALIADEPHPPQCGCGRAACVALALAPIICASSDGVEYLIPAAEVVQACAAGIHPVNRRTWDGEQLSGCGACGLVYPAGLPDLDVDPIEPTYGAGSPSDAPIVSDPVATVVAVTTVTERPAPPDPFADTDPAPPAFVDVKRDRWGRYVLPHPITGEEQSWTRATTLARCLSDETKLTEWKLRQAVAGVARNRDLIALAASAEVDDKATLNSVWHKAQDRMESDAGANLGTAFHAFTHRLSRGESLESLRAPAELHADLVAYSRALRAHGLVEVPDLVERIVVNTTLNAAGTFDRFVRQLGTSTNPKPMPLSVLDLKTAKSVEYSWLDIAIQLAIYVYSSHLWDPTTRTYTELPGPEILDRTRGLVLHLPVGKAEPVLWAVNLVEGWEAAQVAEQVRKFRNGSKGYGWLIDPDPETLLLHRVSIASLDELSELWTRHQTTGLWTPTVHAASLERAEFLARTPQ
jgi:hypothetical protein